LNSKDKIEGNDDLQKKYGERIFELYDDRYKTFQKGFSLLIGLSLLFLFIILFPYISIQEEEYRISAKLEELSNEIKDVQKPIDAYQNIQYGISLLMDKINKSPYDLRNFLEELQSKIDNCRNLGTSDMNMAMQQSNEVNECNNIPSNETEYKIYISSQVNDKTKSQYDEYETIINQNISEPLEIFSNESQYAMTLENLKDYKQGLQALQNSLNNTISKDPDFWITFQGKRHLSTSLEDQVNNFSNTYDMIIESQFELMKKKFDELNDNKIQLVQFQKNLNVTKQQISDRINQIEIPFGKIPFGLNESISVFPLALGIGFAVCASLLSNAILFRKSLHEWYSSQSIGKNSPVHQRIPIIAPLWIDPLKPKYNQIINFIVLFVPFILFIISWQMVSYGWSIPQVNSTEITFPIDKNSFQLLYTILYIISFLLFIFSYFRLAFHIHNYKKY
jgi:hypothetical protein